MLIDHCRGDMVPENLNHVEFTIWAQLHNTPVSMMQARYLQMIVDFARVRSGRQY